MELIRGDLIIHFLHLQSALTEENQRHLKRNKSGRENGGFINLLLLLASIVTGPQQAAA